MNFKKDAIAYPDLTFTKEVERSTAPLYERVSRLIPPMEWPLHAPYIYAIRELKQQRNAVILAHNYQTPEIYHCVADEVGDSLQLARLAAKSKADIIVQAGVHFMAETSKILNPDKMVLIPDLEAGCSLAASITGEDIRTLRKTHPGIPIVAYVNTSADVKAEVDICCTSSNARKIVESLGTEKVIFVPDRYLAANVAEQTHVKIIAWQGACEVHERFRAQDLVQYKASDRHVQILAHPECPPEVVDMADFSGSTAALIDYIKTNRPARVLLLTECSMADNIAADTPDVEFLRPCNLCPHMKRITLANILDSLLYLQHEVKIEEDLARRAKRSVQRMIELTA